MSNVVSSLTRRLKPRRHEPPLDPRHRRDGFFDESDNWHDAESESGALQHDSIVR